jgi:hypothetical protein
MAQHTPKVQITSTSVGADGVTSDVIRAGNNFTLVINGTIDQSLFGQNFRFDANFEIVRVADNAVVYNTWWSGSGYPVSVDSVWPSFWILFWWNHADDVNVHSGEGGNAENSKEGMYVFRAYFFVDTAKYSASLYQPNGTSEFAIADDHYFWRE